jgi:hypothetical protein
MIICSPQVTVRSRPGLRHSGGDGAGGVRGIGVGEEEVGAAGDER